MRSADELSDEKDKALKKENVLKELRGNEVKSTRWKIQHKENKRAKEAEALFELGQCKHFYR